MKNDFLIALTQICAERHLSKAVILEAIEQALILAYRRNFGSAQDIEVQMDPNTGDAQVYADKEIVEEVENPRTQILLSEARLIDQEAELGQLIKTEMTPRNFGRIAAQTAKQVILQRIREAERETMYVDWSDRVGEVVMGTIRNIDAAGNVVLALGRAEAVMTRSEQIRTENYRPNQRLRVYIHEVERTSRGPRIRASRTHQKLLFRLLESEVPEIFEGTVEIKAIAREAGSRSKVAVIATQQGVDPIGCCVGMRGVRIQNVVNELNGERIDIVLWAPEDAEFVRFALSPAKVELVWLDADTRTATVVVPDHQLSLAIGKKGQNARLAAKLTRWRIDIKSGTEAIEEAERRAREAAEAAEREAELTVRRKAAAALLAEAERSLALEEQLEMAAGPAGIPAGLASELLETPLDTLGLSGRVRGTLERAGFASIGEVLLRAARDENEFLSIAGFGKKSLVELMANLEENGYLPTKEAMAEAAAAIAEAAPVAEEVPVPEPDEETAEAKTETLDEEAEALAPEVELAADEALPEVTEPEVEQASPETVAEPTEQTAEPTPGTARAEPARQPEEEEEPLGPTGQKKRPRRDIILDEKTGTLVTRQRRKASRQRETWKQWEGDADEDAFEW